MTEEAPIDWQYLAAAYRLEIVTSAEIKVAAERAITEGLYSHALDEIASSYEPILSDVGPLLRTVLDELGQLLPEPLTAAWHVTQEYVVRIARWDLPPMEGMHILIFDVYEELDTDEYPEFSARQSHGLEALTNAFYDHWELENRPEVSFEGHYASAALRAHERHMVKLANDWLTWSARGEAP